MPLHDLRVPKVSDEAPDVELLDDRRRPVRLSELWAAGPLVLLFYRGEASPDCRAQLLDFRDNGLAFKKLGARIAAISTDEPAVSAWLRTERGLSCDLLCDPSRTAVDAWGLLDRDSFGGVARSAVFVIDRTGHVRSRAVEDGRFNADSALNFLRRGGASGKRPLRLRLARVVRRLRDVEARVFGPLGGGVRTGHPT